MRNTAKTCDKVNFKNFKIPNWLLKQLEGWNPVRICMDHEMCTCNPIQNQKRRHSNQNKNINGKWNCGEVQTRKIENPIQGPPVLSKAPNSKMEPEMLPNSNIGLNTPIQIKKVQNLKNRKTQFLSSKSPQLSIQRDWNSKILKN